MQNQSCEKLAAHEDSFIQSGKCWHISVSKSIGQTEAMQIFEHYYIMVSPAIWQNVSWRGTVQGKQGWIMQCSCEVGPLYTFCHRGAPTSQMSRSCHDIVFDKSKLIYFQPDRHGGHQCNAMLFYSQKSRSNKLPSEHQQASNLDGVPSCKESCIAKHGGHHCCL